MRYPLFVILAALALAACDEPSAPASGRAPVAARPSAERAPPEGALGPAAPRAQCLVAAAGHEQIACDVAALDRLGALRSAPGCTLYLRGEAERAFWGACPDPGAAPPELEDAVALEVRIVDESGASIARASVRASLAPLEPLGLEATTGADGVARLGAVPPGRKLFVRVGRPRWRPAPPFEVVSAPGPITIALPATSAIVGRALPEESAAGAPPQLVGAYRVDGVLVTHHDPALVQIQPDATSWTDERGRYAIGGLEPGEYLVRLEAAEGRERIGIATIEPDATSATKLDLEPHSGGDPLAVFVRHQGVAVEDAIIELVGDRGELLASARTDRDGRAAIHAVGRAAAIRARHTSLRAPSQRLRPLSDTSEVLLELRALPPRPLRRVALFRDLAPAQGVRAVRWITDRAWCPGTPEGASVYRFDECPGRPRTIEVVSEQDRVWSAAVDEATTRLDLPAVDPGAGPRVTLSDRLGGAVSALWVTELGAGGAWSVGQAVGQAYRPGVEVSEAWVCAGPGAIGCARWARGEGEALSLRGAPRVLGLPRLAGALGALGAPLVEDDGAWRVDVTGGQSAAARAGIERGAALLGWSERGASLRALIAPRSGGWPRWVDLDA